MSDEAPPLGETISQMFGVLLLRDSFEPVDFEYCGIVALFSRSNVKAFGPGPCVPEGEYLNLFLRQAVLGEPGLELGELGLLGFAGRNVGVTCLLGEGVGARAVTALGNRSGPQSPGEGEAGLGEESRIDLLGRADGQRSLEGNERIGGLGESE
jgi:hypothetical protein